MHRKTESPTVLLEGYKEYKPSQWKKIKTGDYVRYVVDKELKKGGHVKFASYPDYIVLINYVKKVSWSVQLKQPDLHLWVKSREDMQKERDEKKRVFMLYKQGKLIIDPKAKSQKTT